MSNDNKIKEKDDNDRRLGMFATIIAILGIFIPWGRDIGTQANPAPIEICFFGVLLGICLLFTVVFCSSKVYHIWRNILKWIGELICRWYDNFLLLSTKSLRELLSNVESDGKTDPVDSAVQVDSTKQETFTPDFGQSGSLEQKESGSRVSFIYEGEEFAFLYCEPNADFKMGGPITVKGQSSDGKKTDAPIPVPEIKDAPILEGFWIGETPVTQEQWKKIGVQPKRDCYVTDDEHPVESVSIK